MAEFARRTCGHTQGNTPSAGISARWNWNKWDIGYNLITIDRFPTSLPKACGLVKLTWHRSAFTCVKHIGAQSMGLPISSENILLPHVVESTNVEKSRLLFICDSAQFSRLWIRTWVVVGSRRGLEHIKVPRLLTSEKTQPWKVNMSLRGYEDIEKPTYECHENIEHPT